jgi:soluble P-type ATPase
MLEIAIPGGPQLEITHLVLDYNGTLAVDGAPMPGCLQRLEQLAKSLEIHVVTADTFGSAAAACDRPFIHLEVLAPGRQDEAKRDFVRELGSETVVAVGNGLNDRLMLEEAALGLALLQDEGVAAATLSAADAVYRSILDALDALASPKRLVATLRR